MVGFNTSPSASLLLKAGMAKYVTLKAKIFWVIMTRSTYEKVK